MKTWAKHRLEELEKEHLCGYIFKSKSPSSGMKNVKVYNNRHLPLIVPITLLNHYVWKYDQPYLKK